MNKLTKFSLGITAICFVYIVGLGFHQFLTKTAPWIKDVQAEAGFSSQTDNDDLNVIIGTKSITSDGTVSTTSEKLTAGYTCYDRNTKKIGQVDTEILWIPYEDDTELNLQIHKSLDGSVFYKQLMQTNASSTATYRVMTHKFELDEDGTGFNASSTLLFDLPRDYSGAYYRLCVKEVGVSSAYGDIFAEQIFSANNLQ